MWRSHACVMSRTGPALVTLREQSTAVTLRSCPQ